MTGHPHKGKRSPWMPLMSCPPTLDGPYEWMCRTANFNVEVFVLSERNVDFYDCDAPLLERLRLHGLKSCPYCFWRGLAEKPE